MPELEKAMRKRSIQRSLSRTKKLESAEEISRMRSTFYQKNEKDPTTINIMNDKKRQAKDINGNLALLKQYLVSSVDQGSSYNPGYIKNLLGKLLEDEESRNLIVKEEGPAKNILHLLEKVVADDPGRKKEESPTELEGCLD
jgi:hypothetical protein